MAFPTRNAYVRRHARGRFFCWPPVGRSFARRHRRRRVESITVTGDPVHLLQTSANDAAFGLDKPLLETPRAVTLVSDTTIARYGITGVNDLTAITPSAYTASYYGVEGAVILRGTLAENYFRGFKRAENRGTYSTPLADAAGIEILRGPPSPSMARARWAGWSTSCPRAPAPATRWAAKSPLTYGSYSKRNADRPVQRAGHSGRRGGRRARLWRDRRQFQFLSRHPSQPSAAGIVRRAWPRATGPSPPTICITIPMAMCRRRAGTA